MKKTTGILLVFILALSTAFGQANQDEITRIRQQMAKIRQTTNWNDPAAAKKANEEISRLSKQLMMGGNSQGNTNQGNQQNQDHSKDALKNTQLKEEMIDQKMQIWNQVWESVAGGEGADVLLAEPLRKEIVQEFKDEENPSIKNNEWIESITTLVIDMSWPQVQTIIDQMPEFKGIKTLIITSGTKGKVVDLQEILNNAANFPLEELYIINFGSSVSAIPDKIGNFRQLIHAGFFNNNLRQIPSSLSGLTNLQTLYLDMNPISSIINDLSHLNKLKELGLVKTQITEEEITEIKKILPSCKVLSQ